eukprot:gene56552-13656_t
MGEENYIWQDREIRRASRAAAGNTRRPKAAAGGTAPDRAIRRFAGVMRHSREHGGMKEV